MNYISTRMDTPLKYFLIITAVFALLVGSFFIAGFFEEKQEASDLFEVDEQDVLILMAKRQATLAHDTFFLLQKKLPDKAFVRFSFSPARDKVEHLWGKATVADSAHVFVTEIGRGGTDTANYPDELKLNIAEMEDWLIELPDGKIRGGFTVQAILEIEKRQPRANADSLNAQLDLFADKLEK